MFEFDGDHVRAFNYLKEQLMLTKFIIASNSAWPFELLCHASGFALCSVLAQENTSLFIQSIILEIH